MNSQIPNNVQSLFTRQFDELISKLTDARDRLRDYEKNPVRYNYWNLEDTLGDLVREEFDSNGTFRFRALEFLREIDKQTSPE